MNTAIATQASNALSDVMASLAKSAGPMLKTVGPVAVWRFARRNPGVAVAIGLGTAVIAGAAGWVKSRSNEEEAKAQPRARHTSAKTKPA